MSALPPLSALPDAPLVFRIAGWPIETLQGLRSRAFAAAVDGFIAEEARIRVEAEQLSEALHREVPRISDRRQRALVLRVRRYLFGCRAPLPAADLARVLAIPGLDARVRDRIAHDDDLRRRLDRTRHDLVQRHAAATAAERDALFAVSGEPRFRTALLVASPSAGARWEELRHSGGTPGERLTATLWRYAMRAIGRATPHSLWAGVTIEEVGRDAGGRPLSAHDAPPAVRVKPDLNLFHTALGALKRHPRVRGRLTFRANPSLVRHGPGGWRYLQALDGAWVIVESAGDVRIDRLHALLRRDGPLTPAQLAARSGIDAGAVAGLIEAGILWPAVDWPPISADPWEALDGLCARLPATDRPRWRRVVDRLRTIGGEVSAGWAGRQPSEIARALADARAVMNGLLRRYGAEPIAADRCALVVDSLAPFRIAASTEFKKHLADAVRRCCRFDRGGTGELLARGRRRRRDPEIFRQGLPLGGFRPPAGGAPSGDVSPAPIAGEPPEGCWEAEAWQLDDPTTAEEFLAAVRAWTDALAPQAHRRSVSVAALAPATGEPVPPGSALVLVRFTADRLVVRVGSISSDVCAFYARFHHHFVNGPDVYGRWLTGVVAALERIEGLRPSDCAFHGAHDRNAALRPRVTARLLDPFAEPRAEHHVARDAKDRLHLRAGGARDRTVPLINSAADLSAADPYSAWLQAQAHLLGRPSLLRPLPPLAEELRTWRHLPQLDLDGDVVISAERWHVAADDAAAWAALEPFERFLAWRKLAGALRVPELVYAHFGPHRTESLMPVDSVLAVEMLARSLRAHPGGLRFQDAFARPEELWLRDARGAHYVTEIAVAWAGDEAFWRELASGSRPDRRRRRRTHRGGTRGSPVAARRRPRALDSRR